MSALAEVIPAVDTRPFHDFVGAFTALLDDGRDERTIREDGGSLLEALVAADGWLPDDYARSDPGRYRQYLLHRDAHARFSIVSFVWGPGQATPIHDHRVWGLVGVLRGAERVTRFDRDRAGRLVARVPHLLRAGEIDMFGPAIGDLHRVANAHDDRVSISIHVYGGDIGTIERATYTPDGAPKRFVSGYANGALPPLSKGFAR